MKCVLVLLLVMLPFGVWAQAPAPDTMPVLTEVQRLQVENSLQRLELTQLRFERARDDFQALIKTLVVPGWQLDLTSMQYVKTPDAVKK